METNAEGTFQEEEGITISETLIKMEPEEQNIDFVMDEGDSGNFLTVLVPENLEEDVKPVICSACNNVIEADIAKSQNNSNTLCKQCQKSGTHTTPIVNPKKVLLNVISNSKNTIPFRCHYCSKTYDTKESFYNHIRLHAAKKRNPYLCGMCGKNFKELIQFKKHICARNVLKCNRCSKQFESIFRLENHYQIHSKYKCEQCGKCLSSKTVLEEHKRVHTNEYPFKCEKCSRQFRQKSKFNAHIFMCRQSNATLSQKMVKSEPLLVE